MNSVVLSTGYIDNVLRFLDQSTTRNQKDIDGPNDVRKFACVLMCFCSYVRLLFNPIESGQNFETGSWVCGGEGRK